MRAYSLDLRENIVESVKKGVPKSETAHRFGADRQRSVVTASNSMSAAPWSQGNLLARNRSRTRRRRSCFWKISDKGRGLHTPREQSSLWPSAGGGRRQSAGSTTLP